MEAVILAAGKGSRMGDLTKDIPKAMLPVLDKPHLENILDELKTANVKKVVIVTHHLEEVIKNHFGYEYGGMELVYVHQNELNGDADALSYAEPFITESFFYLMACDNWFQPGTLHEIRAKQQETGANGVLGVSFTYKNDAKKKGVLEFYDELERADKIRRIVEKSDDPPSLIHNVFVMYMSREIFRVCNEGLQTQRTGEYRVTDCINKLLSEGKFIDYSFTKIVDIGNPETYSNSRSLIEEILHQ